MQHVVEVNLACYELVRNAINGRDCPLGAGAEQPLFAERRRSGFAMQKIISYDHKTFKFGSGSLTNLFKSSIWYCGY